jgi:hypothetical protein
VRYAYRVGGKAMRREACSVRGWRRVGTDPLGAPRQTPPGRQLGRGAELALMVMEMESKTVSEKWIGITRRASNSCDQHERSRAYSRATYRAR